MPQLRRVEQALEFVRRFAAGALAAETGARRQRAGRLECSENVAPPAVGTGWSWKKRRTSCAASVEQKLPTEPTTPGSPWNGGRRVMAAPDPAALVLDNRLIVLIVSCARRVPRRWE